MAQAIDLRAKQKERQAWIVLVASLALFMLFAILSPYAANRFYQTATEYRAATLEPVAGTVRLSRQGSSSDVAANNGETILEGTTVKTDNTSRALLTLFDGSTVYMYENTELVVNKLRGSRFTDNDTIVDLSQPRGRLRVGVAPATTRIARFVVTTPHGSMSLLDGSYAVEVSGPGTNVSARAGSADVTALKSTVSVKRGQRTTIALGQTPAPPQAAALDLVLNGDFSQRDLGWTIRSEVEAGRRDDVNGQMYFEPGSEGTLVHFVRGGSKNSHSENALYQIINRDVSDFVSLKLAVDFKLLHQSLSGGGYLGSEYPLLVSVVYRDESGAQHTWSRGFYYENEAGYSTTYGEQTPAEVWIPYEKDLFALDGYPKPFRILSVEVVASGWDYESLLKTVSILAE